MPLAQETVVLSPDPSHRPPRVGNARKTGNVVATQAERLIDRNGPSAFHHMPRRDGDHAAARGAWQIRAITQTPFVTTGVTT